MSGISALGRNLTELAQLVSHTARRADGGGGGGGGGGRVNSSMPDLGYRNEGGDHSRRRSTGATRLAGSSVPKPSPPGGARMKKRSPAAAGAPSMLGRPRMSVRHAGASAPVGSVAANAKLDEQLARQWPSMRMANSSAGLSGVSQKLPAVVT